MKEIKVLTALRRTGIKYTNILGQRVHPRNLDRATQPVRADFAHIPTQKGFNWQAVGRSVWLNEPRETRRDDKYLVVFRSRRLADADVPRLVDLEEQALTAAKASGDLIIYKPGPVKDDDLSNVSYCIWRSAKTAYEVSHSKPHAGEGGAIEEAAKAYEEDGYLVEVYGVRTRRTPIGLRTKLNRLEKNPFTPEQVSA
jgi:hypothetical protein